MGGESTNETIRQRSKLLGSTNDTEKPSADTANENQSQEEPKNTLKYYFNRFRYYHFYIAEKVDMCIGVMCLAILKLYFFLMGYGPASYTDGFGGASDMVQLDD